MREEVTMKDQEVETMRLVMEAWATKERQSQMESQMDGYAEEEVD